MIFSGNSLLIHTLILMISQTTVEVRTWMSNYMQWFDIDVFTYPCLNSVLSVSDKDIFGYSVCLCRFIQKIHISVPSHEG